MELQGGRLALDVDADLFSVELTLPLEADADAAIGAATDAEGRSSGAETTSVL